LDGRADRQFLRQLRATGERRGEYGETLERNHGLAADNPPKPILRLIDDPVAGRLLEVEAADVFWFAGTGNRAGPTMDRTSGSLVAETGAFQSCALAASIRSVSRTAWRDGHIIERARATG